MVTYCVKCKSKTETINPKYKMIGKLVCSTHSKFQ